MEWISRELRVVWEPPRRYAVSRERRPGYWAVFSRDGADAGILETDGVLSLTFEGRGGETDLGVKANSLIFTFAGFGYTSKTAFALVRGLLELEEGVTSVLVHGSLPRRHAEPRA
ncbi:MAG: hypothetical protein ACJ71Z_04610 [Aeromicrobium sp.]